jgi:4-hydroxy-tetrahydrodipicolinate synthase
MANQRSTMRAPASLSGRDLRGVIVPIVTPFAPNGGVDEASFTTLLEGLLAAGVHGVVIGGTTGESPTLRWPEVERLIACARAVVRGQLPLLVGTGTYDTAESVERTERARVLGADAAFVVTPYYNRPAPAGVLEHFRRICTVGLPVVAYHIPYRTGLTLDLPTLRALLALQGVVALKESSGGLHNVAPLAGESAILCGEDALFLPALEAGAAGGILAAANLLPQPFVELHAAFRAGRPLAARTLAARLRPLVEALFAEPNPAPLKHALALEARIASSALRLPMVPPSPALGERLARLLRARAPGDAAAVGALDELAARFAAQAIPASEWNHRCHLLVGAWHVFHLGPDLALERLRAGIRRLNQVHGTPETETRGYHETITRAHVELLAIFLGGFPAATPLEARAAALLESPLASPQALLRFYDRPRLLSPAARAGWLEPDREPLGTT